MYVQNENKGGHGKAGETLFTTKCDEIKTQSESYTLNKEELINDIKSMIEKDKTTMLESLEYSKDYYRTCTVCLQRTQDDNVILSMVNPSVTFT